MTDEAATPMKRADDFIVTALFGNKVMGWCGGRVVVVVSSCAWSVADATRRPDGGLTGGPASAHEKSTSFKKAEAEHGGPIAAVALATSQGPKERIWQS